MAISRALHQGEDSLLDRSAASCRFLGTRETAKTQKRWLPKLQKTFLSILLPKTHRHTGTHTHKAPDAEMDSELLIQPISVSPPPGAVLVLHSLLLEFPLAMVFAEQLLTYSVGETIERSEDELDTVPTSVLIQVVELLGLIFHDTKVTVMNRVLNAAVQWTADNAAPEITLNLLEIVGGKDFIHTEGNLMSA
ncbi:uncharacterized protein isoform X4 [Danio rerio]|uniref:Uncharacterized protein isoform X4 n=4 Tax=Danio rerio TaxID=7955 RepID=A0AC58ID14_DANRE